MRKEEDIDIFLQAKAFNAGIKTKYLGKHLVQKKVCMTKDIGIHGNLFGGNLLQWIDEAAAGFIHEALNHHPVVTLKISEVLFKEPVKVNDVINIDVQIIRIGKTSITVDIQVVNTKTGNIVCTLEAVFVHVDKRMKPKKIAL
jgi:acyl-CoA thioesterase YciA